MRRQAVRILMIQLVLAFILVNFNNCSGGFESGGLGGGELSEQDSSSTGTDEANSDSGPVDEQTELVVGEGPNLVKIESGALFLRANGSDSNPCTQDLPCQTLAKVTGMATGRDLALYGGETFYGSLDLWPGTSDNWTKVLSYKVVDGIAYESESGDPKALIHGGIPQASFEAGTVNYSAAGYAADPYVSDPYDPLVRIEAGDNYVKMQRVDVGYVRTSAIYVVGTLHTPGSLHHVELMDVDITHTGDAPIVIGNGAIQVVYSDFEITYTSLCEDQRLGGSGSTETCDFVGWPGGVVVVRAGDINTPAEVLIHNGTVDRQFGEAYNCYDRNSYVIFHRVKAARVHSNGAYPDGSDYCVFEHFQFTGTHGSVGYFTNHSTFGGALNTGVEAYAGKWAPTANKNVYRNGTLHDTGSGMTMGIEAHVANKTFGFRAYNLTIVDPYYNVYKDWGTYNSEIESVEFRNSYIYAPTSKEAICQKAATVPVFSYLGWMDNSPASNCVGTNGITRGVPNLPYALTQYDSIDTTAKMNWEAFRLQTGADGADDGDPDIDDEVLFNPTELANFGYALDRLLELEPEITKENWAKKGYYCAEGGARPEAGGPMGAVCELR